MTETTLMEPIYVTHEPKRKSVNQSDAKILEAIDESLDIFGEAVKQFVYFHLESNCHMRKQDIPRRIEEFAIVIEGIFGNGARLIQIRIIEMLYSKADEFQYYPNDEDLVFKDYMQNMRKFMKNSFTT